MIYKIIITFIIVFIAPNLSFPQGKYSRKNIPTKKGDTVSLSFPEKDGRRWEVRVIDKELVQLLKAERKNNLLYLKLGMKKAGLGRMEAVEIHKNIVKQRIYYFFKIKAATVTDKTAIRTNDSDTSDNTKKKTDAAKRQYDVAMRVYNEGSFDQAARLFKIFIDNNKQSDLILNAMLYRGIALYNIDNRQGALKLFQVVSKKAEGELKERAVLWSGHVYRSQKAKDKTLNAYLKVIGSDKYPALIVAARLGLARYYAQIGELKLADLQFEKLLKSNNKGEDSKVKSDLQYAKALAFYYAAIYYDKDVNQIWKAYRFYRQYVEQFLLLKKRADLKQNHQSDLQRKTKFVEMRIKYLKKHFIDYR